MRDDIKIYTGDFRQLSDGLDDNSVSAIITDPVYDHIDDYRYLAQVAARVLRPGGNVIAQTAHYYLPEVLAAMRPHLDYVWTMAETFPFGGAKHFGNRIRIRWKPHVWFTKGKRQGRWIFDAVQASGRTKNAHKWGDSPTFTRNCIERLTEPGDLVLDPFLGGGTTALACLQTGRRCIGYELDPEVADVARHRVDNAQLPAFTSEMMHQASFDREAR